MISTPRSAYLLRSLRILQFSFFFFSCNYCLHKDQFSKLAMRLLNCRTMTLEDHYLKYGPETPDYAILSHTWGEEEILFDDLQGSRPEWKHKEGAPKVLGSIAEARRLGFSYIWIDTCCIDKRSSADLSEAINSMFNWYMRSDVCIAYLSDVASPDSFAQSKWFTRGWTLQELIAPYDVRFYGADWTYLGDRETFAQAIVKVTSVPHSLLTLPHLEPRRSFSPESGKVSNARLGQLSTYSISDRMSWASRRQTARPEDIAYCLMGLFDVNMPLLYGEGVENAFFRLQQAIIDRSQADHSILFFSRVEEKVVDRNKYSARRQLLAPLPAFFDLPIRMPPVSVARWSGSQQFNGYLHMTKRDELQIGMLLGPVARWRRSLPVATSGLTPYYPATHTISGSGERLVMGVLMSSEIYHDGEPSRVAVILEEEQGIFRLARGEWFGNLPLYLLRTRDPIIGIAETSLERTESNKGKWYWNFYHQVAPYPHGCSAQEEFRWTNGNPRRIIRISVRSRLITDEVSKDHHTGGGCALHKVGSG